MTNTEMTRGECERWHERVREAGLLKGASRPESHWVRLLCFDHPPPLIRPGVG